jgi:hypothetical protein
MQSKIDAFIKKRVDDQIEWYSAQASKNKKFYIAARASVLLMSAAVPIITAYDFSYSNIFLQIFGVSIVCIRSMEDLMKFHENWINYRSTSESLKHEKYVFISKSDEDQSSEFQNFVLVIENIISQEAVNWNKYSKIDATSG